jgi:hypothetical protein
MGEARPADTVNLSYAEKDRRTSVVGQRGAGKELECSIECETA